MTIEQAFSLAVQQHQAGRLGAAERLYRQIVAVQPGHLGAIHLLGAIAHQVGRHDLAVQLIGQAIAGKPVWPQALSNRGEALRALGRLDEAIADYSQAIALDPGFDDAHLNMALALLLRGDFARGCEHFERRWKCAGFPSTRPDFRQPQWDGSRLVNSTLFLYSEQGFGDTIQFIRYLPLIVERCPQIVVMCQPEVRRLIEFMPGVARWMTIGEPVPEFDVHCPLLSLPRAFHTTLQTIPNSVPYLYADAAEIQRWGRRLASDNSRLKVGLAWAGRSTHPRDSERSVPLSLLAPLAESQHASFYSLHVADAGTQVKKLPAPMQVRDFGADLHDFADTAALIANMDLIISVDTAVAHLAGAMGKPVWTLLPYIPDWRWLLDREDSPWYPTMRLFRQEKIGDWGSVIRRIAAALKKLSFDVSAPPG